MESNSSSLIAYSITPMQCPSTINLLLTKLSSNILDSEFNDEILDTLIFNLVPNLNKLELLGCEV